ncbi:hypothetical protein EVAR_54880_1 [Eumeta japonica]|uniref:Uncharacterized protein n=1 Tax=Eumeta variegata TaxID=151549 RepID=A0A4C1ZVH4_EUMVA|nr:hypothetical protein EVAR_54880_1 [Eumeta japonica]
MQYRGRPSFDAVIQRAGRSLSGNTCIVTRPTGNWCAPRAALIKVSFLDDGGRGGRRPARAAGGRRARLTFTDFSQLETGHRPHSSRASYRTAALLGPPSVLGYQNIRVLDLHSSTLTQSRLETANGHRHRCADDVRN